MVFVHDDFPTNTRRHVVDFCQRFVNAAGAYGLCTASSQGSHLGEPLHVITREFRQQLPGEEYYLPSGKLT